MYTSTVTGLSLIALITWAYASPLLQGRATSDPGVFAEMQRAAKLSSAAYTGYTGTAFDATITTQLNDKATDTQGFIGYLTTEGQISVLMRGSPTTAGSSIYCHGTRSGVTFPSGVQVMEDVFSPWSSIHKKVIQDNFPDNNVTSNALAAFPIGNCDFAAIGTDHPGLLRRVNNEDDGGRWDFSSSFHELLIALQETYSYGTEETCLLCNGSMGVTEGHFSSFGVELGYAGCFSGI
ncbi:hypothetical protein BGW36DRAFT_400911 [Talaromyces proteolyticus]|uniref:Uncharacterized protein n=1 Tax=Talaromyces proteolyticus TaxID=1131652 RepID=A0AAD4PWM7_9EURO|nr:uncharacterized protein BGW36DRAFT_400911 [Talaromyces proteolyticus]KAH8691689.1 hypothetical protein BGW36DRAFT_400911 [Talaromyces proteolyticus]